MEITKKDLQKLETEFKKHNNELEKKFEMHTSALHEKFEHDLKIMGEGILGIQEQLNSIIEMVAKNTEDIEVIKMDISFIKNNLKQKADKDELEALEKRVLILENKFKRV